MPSKYYRRVIRIRAEDSPNVRLGMAQQAAGVEPTGEVILNGVLTWRDYLKRRATWDKIRQCIGLDAEFPSDGATLMFPPDWLNRAEQIADKLDKVRKGVAMGVDPAEGGDKTCFAVVDHLGLIELVSMPTPDTALIPGYTIGLINKYNIPHGNVIFDRGGGGQQHADRLRSMNYRVRTVAFGGAAVPEPRRINTMIPYKDKVEAIEERYVYVDMRAQLYIGIRERIDPYLELNFGIPAEYTELRQQLAPIPLTYDHEGRVWLLHKNKRDSKDTRMTLTELLDRSPDEADALALAIYGLDHPERTMKIGKPLF